MTVIFPIFFYRRWFVPNGNAYSHEVVYRRWSKLEMVRMTVASILAINEVFTRCHSINVQSTLTRVSMSSEQRGPIKSLAGFACLARGSKYHCPDQVKMHCLARNFATCMIVSVFRLLSCMCVLNLYISDQWNHTWSIVTLAEIMHTDLS